MVKTRKKIYVQPSVVGFRVLIFTSPLIQPRDHFAFGEKDKLSGFKINTLFLLGNAIKHNLYFGIFICHFSVTLHPQLSNSLSNVTRFVFFLVVNLWKLNLMKQEVVLK